MIYEFMATQSFNGYDKPWAGGTNINILPPGEASIITVAGITCISDGNGIYKFSGVSTGYAGIGIISLTDSYDMEPGQLFYMRNSKADGYGQFAFYSDTTQQLYWGMSPANRNITVPEGESHEGISGIRFNVSTAGRDFNGMELSPIITAAGVEAPTEFTPYANVCMPEGFNIWDPTAEEFIQVYAGYVNANTRELYLRPVYKEYAGEELVGPWMSSLDEYSEDATPTEGAFVIDFGGELTSYEITPFMLQTLLESLGIRQHFTDGAGLLNKLMDQAQGRVRSEEELLHLSRPLNVISIGDQLPAGLTFKPISKDVLPGLPGKFIR